jgi:hypothetical protein
LKDKLYRAATGVEKQAGTPASSSEILRGWVYNMLSWIREKFGTAVIGGIISFIAFVFVFYGVFSPKSTRGLHEGAVAGTVDGEPISIADYNRELNRKIEYFKKIAGDKFSDEQLKSFRIREGVFQELANRKLMVQEAQRQGLVPADELVRDRIREIPAFQKDGKFDFATYKMILEQNNQTPGSFERLMKEDLSLQMWDSFFRDRIHVSDQEVKKEYLLKQDKRNIKYVLLTPESAKKSVSIENADVQKFLTDPNKLNLVKMKYEDAKNTLYKDQKFDQVKETIARNILAGEKIDQIRKINDQLADKVAGVMTNSKSSDAKVNAVLKPYNVQIKTTGLVGRDSPYLPGIGEAKDLMKDAFAIQSPINPEQGGKPKKYNMADRVLVALVSDTQKADLSKLNEDKTTLIREITQRKYQDLLQSRLKTLISKYKIETNPSVVTE